MDINALEFVVYAVIAIIGIVSAVLRINKIKKEHGLDKEEFLIRVLDTIRSIIPLAFQEALEFKKADEGGYDAVKDYIFKKIDDFVTSSLAFTDAEKQMLKRETLEPIIEPLIQSLWKYKLEMPQKGLTKMTLKAALEEQDLRNLEE